MSESSLHAAREAIDRAEALLVTAGAGMGVDSGLPDFRGTQGFWRAYPAFERLGLRFEQLANPTWFERDPHLAWGFYGHRLNLYRAATPHAGFATLLRWADRMPHGAFVFTSNVDGHFQRAGFSDDRILECHGSLHHVQCTARCSDEIWPADDVGVVVDEQTMRAADPLPRCPGCGEVARPNVLMFGDWDWVSGRTDAQVEHYDAWLARVPPGRLVIVECGAGSAVPTVRMRSEDIAALKDATLIRINPREPEVRNGIRHISLAMTSLEAISGIDALA